MKHLKENNPTYWKHFKFSISQSMLCFKAAACLLVHSILPFLFESSGSETIKKVADNLKIDVTKRRSFRPLRNKTTKKKK